MAVFNTADILVPHDIDMKKWAVIACDQFTSQPEYWEKVKNFIGDSPSTLNMIFPEVYLREDDPNSRIKNINKTMDAYLDEDIFTEYKDALIYVERTQSDGKTRHGLVGTVDLEEYDYNVGSESKIRATEGTILSRIPPRKKIRENAPLELPHIIMLMDDEQRDIIEPLEHKKHLFKKIYDTDLIGKSGHVNGYLVDNVMKKYLVEQINELGNSAVFEKKYGFKDKAVLALAVGDGNHSLATAKSCWEEIKKDLSAEEMLHHPARYALVELMNIHEPALEFTAIQRVIFDTDPTKLLNGLREYYPDASYTNNGGQKIEFTYAGNNGAVYINNAPSNIPVGTLQKFLDAYMKDYGGTIDYIHGNQVVKTLAAQEKNTIGFMVANMPKDELFRTVILDGALPRKTFSMGTALDKRYYVECRKIK